MFDIQKVAQAMAQRRREDGVGMRYEMEWRPHNCDEAWRLQRAVSAELEREDGIKIGGWKCGLPGDNKWVVAPIYSNRIFREATHCPIHSLDQMAAVEPEFAFVLRSSLPARPEGYDESEIDNVIDTIHMALELITNRFYEPKALSFPELLADGLFNQGLYIGPPIAVAPATCLLSCEYGNTSIDYAGEHPNLAPKAPLYWLVNFLSHQGVDLEAGQVIITGSLAGLWQVPCDEVITLAYEGLGHIKVTFTTK